MRRPILTALAAVFILSIAIGGLGCIGPKTSLKAGAQDPNKNIDTLLYRLDSATEALYTEWMTQIMEKMAAATEIITAEAEKRPGITPAQIDSLDKRLHKLGNDVHNTMLCYSVLYRYENKYEAFETAQAAFNSHLIDLERRLADLSHAVAPWRPDSVTILPGPDDGTWLAFTDEDENPMLWGYKDKSGAVRIEPRFFSHTAGFDAPDFDHIIAVAEHDGLRWNRYYLTKSGKIAGRDSIYVFDNGYDHESEGFIRFEDRKKQMTGMLDRYGNAAIPAEYNALSKVTNGMTAALKDAKRGRHNCDGDDHRSFTGGKHLLIDTLNNVLIEDFSADDININFFSIEKSEIPHPDTTARISFPAKGGGFYSFIHYEKEFIHWLKNSLLAQDLTPEKLMEAMPDSVECSMQPRDDENVSANWKSERRELTDKVFDILKNDLAALSDTTRKHTIDREINYTSIPVFSVRLIPNNLEDALGRDNEYEFSRTDGGYKLSGVSIRNNDLFFSAYKEVPASDFVTLGNRRFRSGDFDEATALYNVAIERDSNNVLAWHNRATASLQKGGHAKAIDDLTRVIALDSNNAARYVNRGCVYYKTGAFAKAVTDAGRAIRMDTSNVDAHIIRALTHAAMGDYKKAAADYDKAAKLKESPMLFHNYSILYAYMGDDAKTDSLYQKAMRLDRRNARDFYEEDIKDYTLIIKYLPKNAIALYHRGVVYAKMEEYAKAAEDLRAALTINPKHALAKKWLGIADAKLKDEASQK
ncbi:MAG: tetratricopeptide repeat protein [Chitinispirillia bacterium]|nr:tetratricopeptide repeat protein [Chitinispirillia bacterium]